MLWEIDKDARAIAALQLRFNVLETDQLAEKTKLMVHMSAMEEELRVLKEENRSLHLKIVSLRQDVLLTDLTGNPIELERVTQFEGRNLFRIPRPISHCIVRKSLRLWRAWDCNVGDGLQSSDEYVMNNDLALSLRTEGYKDGDHIYKFITIYCKLFFCGDTLRCNHNMTTYMGTCFYFVEPI
jgi:hypothetical protein